MMFESVQMAILGADGPGGINFNPTPPPGKFGADASTILGWIAFVVLAVITAAFLVSAASWAWGGHSGRVELHQRGKMGTLYSLVAAFLVASAGGLVALAYGL